LLPRDAGFSFSNVRPALDVFHWRPTKLLNVSIITSEDIA
jgi:hypothetical protein